MGSTKAEVLEIQGIPNQMGPQMFVYGDAQVIFGKDDRVVRWADPSAKLHTNIYRFHRIVEIAVQLMLLAFFVGVVVLAGFSSSCFRPEWFR